MRLLYNRLHESSACGLGLIANIRKNKSRHVVEACRHALERIGHRSAANDGAGILTSIPDKLFKGYFDTQQWQWEEGRIGVGVAFVKSEGSGFIDDLPSVIEQQSGLKFVGWRDVPVSDDVLSVHAASKAPRIYQFFLGGDTNQMNLMHAHGRISNSFPDVYLSSLSTESINYKGMMNVDQVFPYYHDLTNPSYESTFAMIHSRFSTNTSSAWERAQPNRCIAHNGEFNTHNCNSLWWKNTIRERELAGNPITQKVITEHQTDSGSYDSMVDYLSSVDGMDMVDVLKQTIPHSSQRVFSENHPWDGPAMIAFAKNGVAGALSDRNGLRPARYQITKDTLYVASEAGMWPAGEEILETGMLEPGHIIYTMNERVFKEKCTTTTSNVKPFSVDTGATQEVLVPIEKYGLSREYIERIVPEMAGSGTDPLGSMGSDTPLAVFSKLPRHICDFFKQRFAQVTNPPIDPIREAAGFNMAITLHRGDDTYLIEKPMLSYQLADEPVVACLWNEANETLPEAIRRIVDETLASDHGTIRLNDTLTEQQWDEGWRPIPSLLSLGAVHNSLREGGLRNKYNLVVETADCCTVHQFACLFGFGADVIYPYGALGLIPQTAHASYIDTSINGVKKVMSKMGISVLQTYRGGEVFESIGLDTDVTDLCFPNVINTIEHVGFDQLQRELYERGTTPNVDGILHYRNGGETHVNSPASVTYLQNAVGLNDPDAQIEPMQYQRYRDHMNETTKDVTILGALQWESDSIPLERIEPGESIVCRFSTGAMSFGSISGRVHETFAVAMNELGGLSNTGEGGEKPARYATNKSSRIKQIASGRFGVTMDYLLDADELQIKMAQGAKPGEGGELPGYKVIGDIAVTRMTSPGITLISPPPHHDIYSIEDLAQLIFDLKQANPNARVSVKLVSQRGVGTVAVGVAKAGADGIVISGATGGTGAATWTGINHTGSPLEIGLAEAHQALTMNGLRGNVFLETDGQLKTGRDVVVAAMLGADRFGFATAPLISMGCLMMRKCHLNTCPVGIATQNPELEKMFRGKPDHLKNFFTVISQDIREQLADIGVESLDELCGRVDLLSSPNINMEALLAKVVAGPKYVFDPSTRMNGLVKTLDDQLIETADLSEGVIQSPICNLDRTVGTKLCSHMRREGPRDAHIHMKLNGFAGQSLGAWITDQMEISLEGEANDYVGKGLSGGTISMTGQSGNVHLYGATAGEAYFQNVGNRFAIRNSGANAVVSDVGDYCCEYMTGGVIAILGKIGDNFASGHTGGCIYVNADANEGLSSLSSVESSELDGRDTRELFDMIRTHHTKTGSDASAALLNGSPRFVKYDCRKAMGRGGGPFTSSMPVRSPHDTNPTGYDPIPKRGMEYRLPDDRLGDYKEIWGEADAVETTIQASRCLDCGIPFCQTNASSRDIEHRESGCPINNKIPEWNRMVSNDDWKEAYHRLCETNNFPEFTGRACPAPCESACVAGTVDDKDPIAIKRIENEIIDTAFENGWVQPRRTRYNGKRVAVIGSGPSGLTTADELNQMGYGVTVFEKDDRPGGLLMYGIPNMKLDKGIVARRIALLEEEGVRFVCSAETSSDDIHDEYAACVVAVGAKKQRDLDIDGRGLSGIEYADEYLTRCTKALLDGGAMPSMSNKNVVVLGGGDTGTDAIATALRQDCANVTNFELFAKPPLMTQWPEMDKTFSYDYGHVEAVHKQKVDARNYSISVKRFVPCKEHEDRIGGLETVRIHGLNELPNSHEYWEADQVFLAMGYERPEVTWTARDNVFHAGDCRVGASLIVKAIQEGRAVSKDVHAYLQK